MRDWPPLPKPRFGRAVFLDRDGTINEDTDFPHDVKELEFVPNAIEGLKRLAVLPVATIVVSNQAGIALGRFTREQMSRFNAELRSRIEGAGGRIDALYFCPHLEPKHLPAGVSPCSCSKPAPGMLLEAAKDFQLDLSRSFLIGDKSSDVAAGKKVGCVTVLVHTGYGGAEDNRVPVEPTRDAEDLLDAATIVGSYFREEDSGRKALSGAKRANRALG